MGLECQPGRTVIKLEDIGFGDELLKNVHKDSGESSVEYSRPQHMTDELIGGGGGMINGGQGDMSGGGNEAAHMDGEIGGIDEGEDVGENREADEITDVEEPDPDKMERKGAKKHRRSHMNFQAQKDESCKVCVCSVEGKDEYCSRRPAMNVNECLRMADIMEDFQQNVPFNTDSVLAYRIRRGQGGSTSKNQGLSSAGDS